MGQNCLMMSQFTSETTYRFESDVFEDYWKLYASIQKAASSRTKLPGQIMYSWNAYSTV